MGDEIMGDEMTSRIRWESDTLGEICVPCDCYWGASTQRVLTCLSWGAERFPAAFIHAFGHQKWASTSANASLGLLSQAHVMQQAADELSQGCFDDQVPVTIWQSGSGTHVHMNINEVLANRANELLGKPLGSKAPIHPHDHVNLGQSSNDSVPTVMHMTLIQGLEQVLFPGLCLLHGALLEKACLWSDVLKVGRTHLQDAVSMTVGQEISAFAEQIAQAQNRLQQRDEDLYALAQGGTAIGTGINSHPQFKERFFSFLQQRTGRPFRSAAHAFAAQSSHDALISLSGELNTLSGILYKMANDFRFLCSGPLCGFGEMNAPENEPGSSIMPGKVNPTQAEALLMVAMQVMGWHHATTLAGIGNFQLNTGKPLIFYNLWTSITLLAQGITSFARYFLKDLTVNEEKLQNAFQENPMDLTSQTREHGYEAVADMIKKKIHLQTHISKDDPS